jgi:DNA-directed RNA polymerase subunit RPC12/RpoP
MPRMKTSILALACLLVIGAYFGLPSYAEEAARVEVQRPRANKPQTSKPPATRERASFDHKRNEHAKVSCNVCHRVTPQQIEVTTFPAHPTCVSCHNFAKEYFTRGTGFCGVCHQGGPTSKAASGLFNFKEKTDRLHALVGSDFGIDFSHIAHRKPLPASFEFLPVTTQPTGLPASKLTAGDTARCTDCHQRIKKANAGENELTIGKGHSTCFQCHGMRPESGARENFPYMNDCKECHAAGGQKATHLALLKEFSHADHEWDIRPRKKADYQIKRPADYLCVDCHKSVDQAAQLTEIRMPDESSCGSCHNGRIGQPDVLARDLLDKLK